MNLPIAPISLVLLLGAVAATFGIIGVVERVTRRRP
jgi:hypothetical protein